MSALSEALSPYQTSRDVAKWCDSGNLPMSALFCRLMIDRPPFAPNMIKQWAETNPDVTAQHFADLDSFFSAALPIEIRDAFLDGMRRHAPHLWAEPLTSYVDTPRIELLSKPIYQGGMFAPIKPLDETYRRCTIAQLREWLAPYRDAYPYVKDIDDCDNKRGRIMGYFDRCPHPRPQIGEITITGLKNGNPEGHAPNFADCTDGMAIIENDGSVWPVDVEARAFSDWANVTVMDGSL